MKTLSHFLIKNSTRIKFDGTFSIAKPCLRWLFTYAIPYVTYQAEEPLYYSVGTLDVPINQVPITMKILYCLGLVYIGQGYCRYNNNYYPPIHCQLRICTGRWVYFYLVKKCLRPRKYTLVFIFLPCNLWNCTTFINYSRLLKKFG